jgi:Fe-S cluster biogenesis protein NfuA
MAAQLNGAVGAPIDPEIVRVIEAFDEIVRPEGGSVSFLAIEDGRLRVAYRAGVNEGCPTCVMEPDALGLMMHDMLRDHALQIEEVVVHVARSAGGV